MYIPNHPIAMFGAGVETERVKYGYFSEGENPTFPAVERINHQYFMSVQT